MRAQTQDAIFLFFAEQRPKVAAGIWVHPARRLVEEDDALEDEEDTTERPFRTLTDSFMALFRMAMGNFDMSWFEHPSEAISSLAVALSSL